jgi:hypothetical protein
MVNPGIGKNALAALTRNTSSPAPWLAPGCRLPSDGGAREALRFRGLGQRGAVERAAHRDRARREGDTLRWGEVEAVLEAVGCGEVGTVVVCHDLAESAPPTRMSRHTDASGLAPACTSPGCPRG